MYILPAETEMNRDVLAGLIEQHRADCKRYKELYDLYKSNAPILHQPNKESYKPDNRIVVNFAKYIVDSFNGYFAGIPVKVSSDNEKVNAYLEQFNSYNGQDDNNAELAKYMSIYGHCFELLYLDENAQIGCTYISPEQCFIVYDESIVRRELFGVRYYINSDDVLEGSFSDSHHITYFYEGDDGLIFTETKPHNFDGVPITEYIENEERQAAFESVKTIITEFDKAISEKANDVDYFSDAYLLVLGADLDEEDLKAIRDNRTINLAGGDADKLLVQFLEKPNADATQEHLLDRLQDLIFMISMVANISDENFGASSGVSLAYKLQPMSNLAMVKERKFMAGMQRRYRLISSLPMSPIPGDEWMGIRYKFTRNIPQNLKEESEIVKNLIGTVSQETLLSVLSIVKNAKEEVARMEEENQEEPLIRNE